MRHFTSWILQLGIFTYAHLRIHTHALMDPLARAAGLGRMPAVACPDSEGPHAPPSTPRLDGAPESPMSPYPDAPAYKYLEPREAKRMRLVECSSRSSMSVAHVVREESKRDPCDQLLVTPLEIGAHAMTRSQGTCNLYDMCTPSPLPLPDSPPPIDKPKRKRSITSGEPPRVLFDSLLPQPVIDDSQAANALAKLRNTMIMMILLLCISAIMAVRLIRPPPLTRDTHPLVQTVQSISEPPSIVLSSAVMDTSAAMTATASTGLVKTALGGLRAALMRPLQVLKWLWRALLDLALAKPDLALFI